MLGDYIRDFELLYKYNANGNGEETANGNGEETPYMTFPSKKSNIILKMKRVRMRRECDLKGEKRGKDYFEKSSNFSLPKNKF